MLAADALDHLAEIGEQPVVGRVLVVERRQQQRAAAAELGGLAGQQHGVGDRRRAGAGQHLRRRNAARDQPLQHRDALADAEAVRLAGGAEHGQAVAAVGQQPAAMRRHAIEIDRQVGVHRRQHRGIHAAEQGILHHRSLLLGCGARVARGMRPGPVDDVVFERAGLAFADRAAAHRDAGLVHGLGIAGHQRMPPGEVLALGQPAIGAGRRQPVDLAHLGRRQARRSPARGARRCA